MKAKFIPRPIENRKPHKAIKMCFESFLLRLTERDFGKMHEQYLILSGALTGLWWNDSITGNQWELLIGLKNTIMDKRRYKGGIPAMEKAVDAILEKKD